MKNLKEFSSVIKTTRIIELEEIPGTDLAYYKDCKQTEKNGILQPDKISVGVATKEALLNVSETENINEEIPALRMYKNCAYVRFISDDDYFDMQHGKIHITDAIKEVPLPNSKHPSGRLVLWNSPSQKIADLDQQFISIPVNFDYMRGSITNMDYDLDALLKKLKEDIYVLNRENLVIEPIPFWAREDESGLQSQIRFSYLLPNEKYDKLMDKNLDQFLLRQYILEHYIGAKECVKEYDDDYEIIKV